MNVFLDSMIYDNIVCVINQPINLLERLKLVIILSIFVVEFNLPIFYIVLLC